MRIGRKKFVVLLFGVIVVATSAGSLAYLSTPDGCTTCHEMKPFYDAWKASAHQDVDCHKCHTADTPLQAVEILANDFIKHIGGVNVSEIEQEPPMSPANEVCLACHKSLPSHSEKSTDITCLSCHDIAHYEHVIKIGENYDCSTCHEDHTMVVKESTCKSCHNG